MITSFSIHSPVAPRILNFLSYEAFSRGSSVCWSCLTFDLFGTSSCRVMLVFRFVYLVVCTRHANTGLLRTRTMDAVNSFNC